MVIKDFIWAGFLSLLPISELRGGIPYAMTEGGAPWWLAYLYCVGMNALAAPLAFLFLNSVHGLLYRFAWYKGIFDRTVERSRKKVEPQVDRFGYWGLATFVAIPLPVTGAWTGALVAWILGMKKRKAVPVIIIGVIISGVIVTSIMAMGITAFEIFVKRS